MLNLIPSDRHSFKKEEQHDTSTQPISYYSDAWSIVIRWLLARTRFRLALLFHRRLLNRWMLDRSLFQRGMFNWFMLGGNSRTISSTRGSNAAAKLPATLRIYRSSTGWVDFSLWRLWLSLIEIDFRLVFMWCRGNSLAFLHAMSQHSFFDHEFDSLNSFDRNDCCRTWRIVR